MRDARQLLQFIEFFCKDSLLVEQRCVFQQALLAGKADWGGIKWVEFGADGTLKTPWGQGKWGDAPAFGSALAMCTEFAETASASQRMIIDLSDDAATSAALTWCIVSVASGFVSTKIT